MADIDGAGALGGLFQAGMGFATGNPLAAGAGIAGLGLSIFGGQEKAAASKEMAAASMKTAGLEMQQDNVRRQAMEVSARRQQMEVLRNAQRARSLALNNATSQGAQFGSGLQGGYGQIAGASNWNALSISQGLESGEQMFGLSNQISQQKMIMAQAQSKGATAQGISSLGTSLIGAMGPLKNLGQMGSGGSSSSGGSGGSYGAFVGGSSMNAIY